MEPRLWVTLTATSSKAEVLAAVEQAERLLRESAAEYADVVFPEVPEGFRGCVMSECGRVLAHYGPITENPVLARQQSAGEEDQSVPGWDVGA